jgi:excisionase family DNA binding protein
MPIGRVEIGGQDSVAAEDVLTLEEAAGLLKLPVEVFRARVESGDVPCRRFGEEWRFVRSALLEWLTNGEPRRRSLLG